MSDALTATAENQMGVSLSQYELARRERFAQNFGKGLDHLKKSIAKNDNPDVAGTIDIGAASGSQAFVGYMKSLKEGKACDAPLDRAVEYIVKQLDNDACGGVFVQCGIQSDFGNTKGAFINITRSGNPWTSTEACTPAAPTDKKLESAIVEYNLKKWTWTCEMCSLDANGIGFDATDIARMFADNYRKDELLLQDTLVLNEIFNAANNANIVSYGGPAVSDAPITQGIIEMVTSIRNEGGTPCIVMDNSLYSALLNEHMESEKLNKGGCCRTEMQPKTSNDCSANYVGQFTVGAATGTPIYVLPALEGGNIGGTPDGDATDWGIGGAYSGMIVFDPSAIVIRFGDRSYNKYKMFMDDREAFDTGCLMAKGTIMATGVVCNPKQVTYWVYKDL